MHKKKTHKGLKKRFKVTGTGKVVHRRVGKGHLCSHKTGKKIQQLRSDRTLTNRAESERIRLLIAPGD